MIHSIIQALAQRTDQNGRLILYEQGAGAGWRFCKCRMHLDAGRAVSLIARAEELCLALRGLADYYRETGAAFGTCPAVFPEREEDPSLAEMQTRMIVHWMLYFDGTDCSADRQFSAAAGGPQREQITLARIHRYCRMLASDAPEAEALTAQYEMLCSFVTDAAGEDFCTVDLKRGRYRSGKIGGFDQSDLQAAASLLKSDCALLPEPETGYALLANDLLGEFRPALLHRPEQLKAALDGMLGTVSPFERNVICLRYGLADGCRRKADEAARLLHCPGAVIAEAEASCLRRLKHPARNRALRRL